MYKKRDSPRAAAWTDKSAASACEPALDKLAARATSPAATALSPRGKLELRTAMRTRMAPFLGVKAAA